MALSSLPDIRMWVDRLDPAVYHVGTWDGASWRVEFSINFQGIIRVFGIAAAKRVLALVVPSDGVMLTIDFSTDHLPVPEFKPTPEPDPLDSDEVVEG